MTFHRKLFSKCVLLFFIPACVTTHTGPAVQLSAAPIKVSCSYGADIKSDSFSGIVCNLENLGRSWQDLSIHSVRFLDQADAKIVSAADMKALAEAEAMAIKESSDDHNTDLALGGLILTGVLVAAGARDAGTRAAGKVVTIGGSAVAAGRDIRKGYEKAQYGETVYGPEHLLGGSMRIPAELSIRRQIVIEHSGKRPQTMEICWSKPQNECSTLSL